MFVSMKVQLISEYILTILKQIVQIIENMHGRNSKAMMVKTEIVYILLLRKLYIFLAITELHHRKQILLLPVMAKILLIVMEMKLQRINGYLLFHM